MWKKIGLDYPAGPEIDKLSKMGDVHKFNFPLPMVKGGNVSYSGTKTAFINFLNNNIFKIRILLMKIYTIYVRQFKNLIDNLLNKVNFLAKRTILINSI